ncbi:hypothetical protein E0H22_21990 [Rhodopseudomonas boonkerdii]|uniref:hypothetical protein n=1 Tax=Rhodopseudomonas boonkerdii TaxID=475937 RepID=UPI001E331EE4|nr:hypothetical protein [Rhodopseudomonas boonkerdii]UGV28116.1 hypothetical protein E0H22_21990 [Rhodopseudomonas boonkerdii]
MVARYVLGAVLATTVAAPALAGQKMNADEARKFVAGRVFAFNCNDGTRGAGRVFDDGGAAGAVQFSGTGAARNMRLPGNTLQVRGQNICASLKGLPFEPCFDLEKKDERSFRGSVTVLGITGYCDFRHQGRGQLLMARSLSQPRTMRVRTRSADASAGGETVTRVSTPRVESSKLDPVSTGAVKSEPAKNEPAKAEAMELRKSTD